MNFRTTRAEIDVDALSANANWVRQQIGTGKLLGIVKADGYGHGVGAVCDVLAPCVDAFGVGFTDEALALRDAHTSSDKPVLILEGCQSIAELEVAAENNFWVVIHSLYQLELLEQAKLARPLCVWLKIDTGMHRLGLELAAVEGFLVRLRKCNNVADTVLMSHLANADSGMPLNHYQRQQFEKIKRQNSGFQFSLHNSAALLNPQLRGEIGENDWVRAGLLLYGVNPSAVTEVQSELKPAMSLKAPIIAIHELKKGDSVGYGSSWIAEKPSRIATVAIGYADGYPRQCGNGTPTAVCNKSAPVVGRVSMDMITIDITDIPEACVGDDVELWGARIDVREVANCADTISWHLLTGTSVRVPRVYRA